MPKHCLGSPPTQYLLDVSGGSVRDVDARNHVFPAHTSRAVLVALASPASIDAVGARRHRRRAVCGRRLPHEAVRPASVGGHLERQESVAAA
jgi:hypothetical protein